MEKFANKCISWSISDGSWNCKHQAYVCKYCIRQVWFNTRFVFNHCITLYLLFDSFDVFWIETSKNTENLLYDIVCPNLCLRDWMATSIYIDGPLWHVVKWPWKALLYPIYCVLGLKVLAHVWESVYVCLEPLACIAVACWSTDL